MNCKVCENTSVKNSSISFFRFPKENIKCRDWADRCNLLELFDKHGASRFYKSFRICSEHFDPKDVIFDGRKKRLLQSATPGRLLSAKNPSVEKGSKNTQQFQNFCRLCAEENKYLTDVFGRRGKLLELEKKLKFLPQKINKCDILPVKICRKCVLKIDEFYDFITKCTKAESKLKAMLKLKDCTGSRDPIKTNSCDSKIDWNPLMGTNLNETPKIQDLTENYYERSFEKTFFTDDDTDYLSRVEKTDFAMANNLYNHNLIKEVDFCINVGTDHDYFKIVSQDDELQPETKIQMAQDQTLTEETDFNCDRLESFHDYDTISNFLTHSDLNRESLCEIYDKIFLDRFHKNQNIQPEDSRKVDKNNSCQVCDKEFHEIAFIDSFATENTPDDKRGQRHCQELKRNLKCDETKSNLIQGSNLSNKNNSKSKRRVCKSHSKNNSPGQSQRCIECGKYFRSKASLRQHRAVHSDKRLHNCQECGMSFKRKDTLCNHLRIHTGERPFVCKICGFAFKQRGDCMKHEKNHEKYNDIIDNMNPTCDSIIMDSN